VRFRKKPVEIEAVHWTGHNFGDLVILEEGCDQEKHIVRTDSYGCVSIQTLEGTMLAKPGDWIMRGVKGELYPCKDEIFRATYEEVQEGQS
jgi:hypothetical protein